MPSIDPISPPRHLTAFSGFGIELEYMIVDVATLSVRPLAERLLVDSDGRVSNEVAHGELGWSNELVAHVLELKTNGPAPALAGLAELFHRDVVLINQSLHEQGAMLLPTAMHPLFDPALETQLWPHGQTSIYQAYDRIFGCAGHGWSNLQSMHINLPFANDDEFRRLHAAIRVVLPLIPALSASSPLEQGRAAAWLDGRLRYYRDNQKKIPSISGQVIPEAVLGIADYGARVLEPMYQAISPHDPDGELQDDWLNSRGAIARFDRQTIEIRIIDLQECPAADLAIAESVVALVQAFYEEKNASFEAQQSVSTESLADLLWKTAASGPKAVIESPELLALYGVGAGCRVTDIWQGQISKHARISEAATGTMTQIISLGPLASRITARLGESFGKDDIIDCYKELAECLDQQRLFVP